MICATCDSDLDDGRCHAEQFRPMIGRAGRHGGHCWGGLFPTVAQARDEIKRRRRRRTRRTQQPDEQPDDEQRPTPPAEHEQMSLDGC